MRREIINNTHGMMYVKIGCHGHTFIGVAPTRKQAWSIALDKVKEEAQHRVTERSTLTLRPA